MKLTQDVFKDLPQEFRFAAVDKKGSPFTILGMLEHCKSCIEYDLRNRAR